MNPSTQQTDAGNDPHSLESGGAVVEPSTSTGAISTVVPAGAADANRSPENGEKEEKATKPPFFVRLWHRLNIYILLFLALMLVAAAGIAALVLSERNSTTEEVINTQKLSDDALKQLSNSNVTVGGPKQILNVESSAIFSSSVLLRGNLEVGGDLKLSRDLTIPNITAPGSVRTGQIQANGASISGNTNVQGSLTAHNGLNVTGNTSIAGSLSATQISATTLQVTTLQLNNDLTLSQHIVVNGSTPSVAAAGSIGAGGTTSITGTDTAGSVNINSGASASAGCLATVTFAKAFAGIPHVTVAPTTPGGGLMGYYVNRTRTNFSICSANTPPAGQSLNFDYIVIY